MIPFELEATAVWHLPRPDQRGLQSVPRRVAEQAVLCRGDQGDDQQDLIAGTPSGSRATSRCRLWLEESRRIPSG